jgi:hypothetical protein
MLGSERLARRECLPRVASATARVWMARPEGFEPLADGVKTVVLPRYFPRSMPEQSERDLFVDRFTPFDLTAAKRMLEPERKTGSFQA